MMTGACSAANMDNIRLRKMYGYGSKLPLNHANTTVFSTTQLSNNNKKISMNVHDPPKMAMRSAMRCPTVNVSS